MKIKHSTNIVWFFVSLCVLLLLLFFTNDFSLTDVQETSIVIAVGVDREEEDFLITSQVALPTPVNEGGAKTTQVLSRGKTVAEAFAKINAKTGWYPKLVFCKLIIIGKEAAKENVFDALDFFLRSEYIPDSCLIAVAQENAGKLLDTKTPIDKISGIAAQKVLSSQAKRLGTAAPTSLREFASQYYAEGKSGFLPILKTDEANGEAKSASSQSSSSSSSSLQKESSSQEAEKIFKAGDCALFREGKWVGELKDKEAFALYASKNKLRLADYSVDFQGKEYTLNFRVSSPESELKIDENGVPRLKISVKATAGLSDSSSYLPVTELADQGQMPDGLLRHAEKTLKGEITAAFEACRALSCDALELFTKLKRYENEYFPAFQQDLLKRVVLSVEVKIDNVR